MNKNRNKITLCIEGIGASWYDGLNTYPSREELLNLFSDFIWKYVDPSKESIQKVTEELEITLLPISDPGQESLLAIDDDFNGSNTKHIIKEYYFPVYYIEMSSDCKSLIKGIIEDLDYRKHLAENLSSEDLDYLTKWYYQTHCSGNILYLHYIPEGSSLEEHKKLIKSKYN